MVRLREIPRTAVFAWWSGPGAPLIVTGTRAGALDGDLSGDIKLELWSVAQEDKDEQNAELSPIGSATVEAAFNDIAWSEADDDHPLGVIAGALEDGAVALWDAHKLKAGASDAFISKTNKHTGSVKALQWNPHRHNLLASVGAKGEIYIYDLNNMANPFRLGGTAARADDIECLDWNKQEKTAHILATGSSGGFVTVWDVKQKRDILTLNNQGRKAVSAVAWDPEESTKLATASPNDQSPLILMWNLRQSSAPERELKGHELGVLGLAWCLQDPELLLSCSKDNRTICWNPKTGERYGDFAAGYWAIQAKWNPHNPSLIASASLDGKILITSIQNANSKSEDQSSAALTSSGAEFFDQVQTQPQGISFNVPKAPKWLARPASVAFGFGGKLVRVSSDATRKSKISIESFAADDSVGEATSKFEEKLKAGDVTGICSSKIEAATTDEEKADWQMIETLSAGKSRKKLREYLGFDEPKKVKVDGEIAETKAEEKPKDDDFFGSGEDGDNFLGDLAATKGAKTNKPFHIYTGSESDADKSITKSLMLGDFEAALDVCLKEDRISDAFMIAVCGGQKCIDKAQAAYLKKESNGPTYLRLLASIVGKNLWDVVHNADLSNWKETMATLCTYADETEFSDLCEVLGDRLEEAFQQGGDSPKILRRDASFCYLAGAKLEKVVNNWVQELHEQEKAAFEKSDGDNSFTVHAKCLQDFVEKVSVFRKVTNFRDAEIASTEDWKLAPLYKLYEEYAEILSAHGQLVFAEQYLDLVPPKFGGAESGQQRLKNASRRTATAQKVNAGIAARAPRVTPVPAANVAQPFQPAQPLVNQARNAPSPYAPAGISTPTQPVSANPYAPASNPYAPAGYQPPQNTAPYGQPSQYGGYQPPQQQTSLPPPPRGGTTSPAPLPASQTKPISDWNDLPENFLKERTANSRRGTPGPQVLGSPFNPAPNSAPLPSPGTPYGFQKPVAAPLPPPPKAGETPPRITSPPVSSPPPPRPGSSVANAYTPQQPTSIASTLPRPAAPPVQRGASPYQPPPSTSTAAPSNRYAPAPGAQSTPAPGGAPFQRNIAPNPYGAAPSPYAPQQAPAASPYGQPPAANPYGQPPAATPYGQPSVAQAPPPRAGPPPSGPPRGPPPSSGPPPAGPPRSGPPPSAATPVQAPRPPSAAGAKYPRGDRSHVPAQAQPIIDLLTPEVARVKSMAPASFKPQIEDMEKRINILFDHLNNETLPADVVQQLVQIAQLMEAKNWDQAKTAFAELSARPELAGPESSQWLIGIKRLLSIGGMKKA